MVFKNPFFNKKQKIERLTKKEFQDCVTKLESKYTVEWFSKTGILEALDTDNGEKMSEILQAMTDDEKAGAILHLRRMDKLQIIEMLYDDGVERIMLDGELIIYINKKLNKTACVSSTTFNDGELPPRYASELVNTKLVNVDKDILNRIAKAFYERVLRTASADDMKLATSDKMLNKYHTLRNGTTTQFTFIINQFSEDEERAFVILEAQLYLKIGINLTLGLIEWFE